MSNPTYTSQAAERNCDPITELALDLRWTWNHSTDELWRELEPELWPDLRFGRVAIASQDGAYSCDVHVYLGRLQPDDVRIEMYADPLVLGPPFRELMTLAGAGDSASFYRYSARVPANRPAHHYTPRAVPRDTVGAIPLEMPLTTWQK